MPGREKGHSVLFGCLAGGAGIVSAGPLAQARCYAKTDIVSEMRRMRRIRREGEADLNVSTSKHLDLASADAEVRKATQCRF